MKLTNYLLHIEIGFSLCLCYGYRFSYDIPVNFHIGAVVERPVIPIFWETLFFVDIVSCLSPPTERDGWAESTHPSLSESPRVDLSQCETSPFLDDEEHLSSRDNIGTKSDELYEDLF